MEQTNSYTLEEAHKHFAQSINGRVWELLAKPNRSQAEDDEMLNAAHACAYHWRFAGTAVHQQRGEWLISHVHVALGHTLEALRHAERCIELTESAKESMEDFDIAYAYEGLARTYALSGEREKAKDFLDLARRFGDLIENDEDKSIFIGDLNGGEWYGII